MKQTIKSNFDTVAKTNAINIKNGARGIEEIPFDPSKFLSRRELEMQEIKMRVILRASMIRR